MVLPSYLKIVLNLIFSSKIQITKVCVHNILNRKQGCKSLQSICEKVKKELWLKSE